jgi:undecaprenyl diphosphate synthase
MTFALAVNYGSRAEIARATRLIAQDVAAGKLAPGQIDEQAVADHLYTSGLPDPELLIRTSGELRLSNYLLWQLAYTEFYVTDTLWPDFTKWDYLRAVRAFQGRGRRFGGVVQS